MDGMMERKFSLTSTQHMPQPAPAVSLPLTVAAWLTASGWDRTPLFSFLMGKKRRRGREGSGTSRSPGRVALFAGTIAGPFGRDGGTMEAACSVAPDPLIHSRFSLDFQVDLDQK